MPLVSKICPSDTYKVWKSGQNLRVDTTLLGFDHMTWQRGNRSFVFRGQGEPAPGCPPHRGAPAEPLGTAAGLGDVVGTMVVPVQPDPPLPLDTSAVVMEIDHDRRVVYSETLALAGHDQEVLLAAVQPTEEQVMGRLTAPVVTTQLDTKNIAFERWAGDSAEPPPPPQGCATPWGVRARPSAAHGALCHPRNKSGILGWRSEKTEMVNGYEAKVRGRVVELPEGGMAGSEGGASTSGVPPPRPGLRCVQRGADHADADRAPLGPAQGQEQRWSRRGLGGWALRRLRSSPPPLPQAVRPPCSPSWASPSSTWGPTMG